MKNTISSIVAVLIVILVGLLEALFTVRASEYTAGSREGAGFY